MDDGEMGGREESGGRVACMWLDLLGTIYILLSCLSALLRGGHEMRYSGTQNAQSSIHRAKKILVHTVDQLQTGHTWSESQQPLCCDLAFAPHIAMFTSDVCEMFYPGTPWCRPLPLQ